MYPHRAAPDYGTAPEGELPGPDHSPGYLVYAPESVGTSHVVGFGPGQLDQARAMAARLRGIVVRAGVIADYR